MREPVIVGWWNRRSIPWLNVGGVLSCRFDLAPVVQGPHPAALVCETNNVLTDVETGKPLQSVMCMRALPNGYTEQQLVMAAASAVRDIYDHEWREQFVYRGERVFNPHAPPGLVLPVRP